MACGVCGSRGQLFTSIIEGVKLNVCGNCSSHGKVISQISNYNKANVIKPRNRDFVINDIILKQGYGELIRISREKLSLKQDELAAKLSIKESLLKGLENNRIEPSIELAKRLELFLGIKIIEEVKLNSSIGHVNKVSIFTIGDLIKKDK